MDVDWKVLLELWVMGLETVEMEEMFWKWNQGFLGFYDTVTVADF